MIHRSSDFNKLRMYKEFALTSWYPNEEICLNICSVYKSISACVSANCRIIPTSLSNMLLVVIVLLQLCFLNAYYTSCLSSRSSALRHNSVVRGKTATQHVQLSTTAKTSYIQRNVMTMTLETALTERKAKIPLRIAIAGSGIGGIFLGNALRLKGFNVTVFEKAAKFSRFGGPIQLASNALSCVHALSPELFERIMGRFTFTGTRKCGIKDGLKVHDNRSFLTSL